MRGAHEEVIYETIEDEFDDRLRQAAQVANKNQMDETLKRVPKKEKRKANRRKETLLLLDQQVDQKVNAVSTIKFVEELSLQD